MKPKYNASKFRNQTVVASLVTAIVVCFASSASATTWVGNTNTNWNDNLNWTGDVGTGGSNATINTSPANIATISANIVATPVDIFINGTGRLDHTAGTASTGAGNWMFVANNSGNNAIYNLANTAAAGGGLTGFAQGSGSMDVKGRLYVAGAFNTPASAPIGTANVNTSGTLAIGADLAIGANGGIGVMNVDAGTITSNGWNFIGKNEGGGGSNGTLKMSGGILTNSFRTYVGQAATTGTLALTGGTYKNMGDLFIVGEGAGSTGMVTHNNSASLFHSGSELWLGEAGGTGSLNLGNGVYIAKNNGTTGTDNLNGGRLIAKGVYGNGSTGVGTFNFNGGALQAGTGVNPVFMSGIDNVIIMAGGATIDTAANTAAIDQLISEDAAGRTLTKVGTGTLLLNSFNTYMGTTSVAAGTLGGTGAVAGAVLIGAAGNINPGVTTGTLYVDSLAFVAGGKLTIDLAAATDTIAVTNSLNLTHSSLVLTGTPTLALYLIASYGAGQLTGTFPGTAPVGYSFDYNYGESSQIALVRTATPYDSWIATYFPGEIDPAIIGKTADPDSDGSSNMAEFALGGAPNSGSNNPKVYSIIGDSSDVGTANELLMTSAVRTGTPAFSGPPSPSATMDGIIRLIQGSLDLGTFTSPTSVVTPVITGIPASPPAGYEYRTFSLTASDGVPNTGFLRVHVVATP